MNLGSNYDIQLLPNVILESSDVHPLDLLGIVDEFRPNAPDLSLGSCLEIFVLAYDGRSPAFSTFVSIIKPTAKPTSEVIVILEKLSVKRRCTITLSCDGINACFGRLSDQY